MSFSASFNSKTRYQCRHHSTLKVNGKYEVVFIEKKKVTNTKYAAKNVELMFVTCIDMETNEKFNIFLPQFFTEAFTEKIIEDINNKKGSFVLIYKGSFKNRNDTQSAIFECETNLTQ